MGWLRALCLGLVLCAVGGAADADRVLNDTSNGPHPVLDWPKSPKIAGADVRYTPADEKHGRKSDTLVIQRDALVLLRLRAYRIELNYINEQSESGPNLIVTTFTGGAHCCFTVHALWLGQSFKNQVIPVEDNDEVGFLGNGTEPPKLQFGDFTFAYWFASFADSPAPNVVLHFDPQAGQYVPDIEAMRKPAPDDAALAAMVDAIKKAESNLPKGDEPPAPELWRNMLDLIYSGNPVAARKLVDLAWPQTRDGEEGFLACFTGKLVGGYFWKNAKLGELLGADAVFHAGPGTKKACKKYEE